MYCVIGANGYLGAYMRKAILEMTDESILCVCRSTKENSDREKWLPCDVTDRHQIDILIDELKSNEDVKIIYLAAYHNPDLVEQNKEKAWDINVTSLSYFVNKASFAKEIYYPSTDSVYGESIDFYHYKENDALKPVNFYGHNKCAAESIMFHLGRNVVRFPFLISPSLTDKPHFYDRIVDSLKKNEPFEMFEDSYRSSLSFENAANLTIALIEKGNGHPVVNVCGDADLSKYDVGVLLAKKEGLDPSLIIPITMNKTVEGFATKRAKSTLMDNSLLKELLGLEYVDIFERPEHK